MQKRHLIFFALLISGQVFADAVEQKNIAASHLEDRFGIMGVPVVSYSSDEGIGFGAVGTYHRLCDSVKPYRHAIDAQIFVTTKGMHSHFLRLDHPEIFQWPIRFIGKVGFLAYKSENYCGQGLSANCENLQLAKEEIDQYIDKNPNANRSELENSFFKLRYFEIYSNLQVRWRLRQVPNKLEALFGWRGSYYIPGTWNDLTPYPASLYARDFDVQKHEKGFASVFETGFMHDSRDSEFNPKSGNWSELTFRLSAPWVGSAWDYMGFNISVRQFLPLGQSWTFATQSVVDLVLGDAPLEELVRVGNSLSWTAFGGANIGRGIREQYFPGKLKFIEQMELRWIFSHFSIFKEKMAAGAVAFIDLGYTSWDLTTLEKQPFTLLFSTGAGLRLVWNDAFVIRLDIAVSPQESFGPRYYLKAGQSF